LHRLQSVAGNGITALYRLSWFFRAVLVQIVTREPKRTVSQHYHQVTFWIKKYIAPAAAGVVWIV
jgi:hypothetical protein